MKLATAFTSPAHKQRYVRRLFATIADRYDLITVLLSFGLDRRWKSRLIDEANLQSDERVLDLACGTGDIAFGAAARGAGVVGLDVTPRMIELAIAKSRRERSSQRRFPSFLVGDMTALPLADRSADVVTTGYGLRNVPVLDEALDEIARVLTPAGRLLSLDFNRPASAVIRTVYLAYLTAVGSLLGWVLHRDPDTYRYIPESVRRYPGAEGLAQRLRARGFTDVRIVPLLGGLMTLHIASRAPLSSSSTDCADDTDGPATGRNAAGGHGARRAARRARWR
jgi:demethylmenaquinone methyltransferase/2-methoxy-6-polyprenyl-1,4-benzoquinol methylase